MRRMNAGMLALAVIGIPLALAAQPAPDRPAFEVVSIKPADPASPGRSTQETPGGFRGKNLRLFELIMGAWNLNRDQIVGGPPWVKTAGWDIEARFPPGISATQTPQMMQAMLADRFGLAVHRETRTLPVYDLTVARGGIKLHPGDSQAAGMSAGPRLIRYDSGSIAELASQLSSNLGRQVIDHTGLTGRYAIRLSFAPVDLAAGSDAAPDSAPSIFQALQEQAGLKLESARAPVEVLVIDHAERPTAN